MTWVVIRTAFGDGCTVACRSFAIKDQSRSIPDVSDAVGCVRLRHLTTVTPSNVELGDGAQELWLSERAEREREERINWNGKRVKTCIFL